LDARQQGVGRDGYNIHIGLGHRPETGFARG
jgi:hypothetical protein